MDYALKLLLTIPIWLVIFKALTQKRVWKQILMHLCTLPLFVFGWKTLFYLLCDFFGFGHLSGAGEVWDIYIPFLFYILQFSLFHVYDYYKQLQHQERIANELRELSLKSEMSILKAQIQPHFLFNTLNSISAGLPREEEHTRECISKLADTFRFAMNTAKKDRIPFKEELSFIQNYLALEQERFTDRLTLKYEIAPQILSASVPPFLLQPLIENALKHGIAKSIEGGSIFVKAQLKHKKLHIEVCDTGAGIDGSSQEELLSKGIGLQNTRLRLQKMFKEELYITANNPKGTRVYFSIPYLNSNE
jgi:LytS/YehU family sensor histidine kinase